MSLAAKLKLAALCLTLLALAAAVFLALAPFLVSKDAIRLRLARDLSSMTGYNVQLREPPHIRIFPVFQAVMPHVALLDNSADNAPLMNADEIIVRMSLWNALRGRARFSETQLIRPHFTIGAKLDAASLARAIARSKGSFGNAMRAMQDRLSGEKNKNSAGEFFQPFGHIVIKDGRLTYPAPAAALSPAEQKNEQKTGQKSALPAKAKLAQAAPAAQAEPAAAVPAQLTDEISAINADIDWPQDSAAASLTASGLWHGARTELDINADNALMLLSGGASPLRISFNSSEGGITFSGKASLDCMAGSDLSSKSGFFAANGHISARSPGLSKTLSWLNIRPPFGLSFDTPFVWESDMKADSRHAELNNIALTLGDDETGDSGRGALVISYADGLPHISGSVAFERLNIGVPAPALFSAPKKSPRQMPALDMPVFSLIGLDVRISAGSAQFNGVQANNIAASVQIQKSGLIFDIGAMQIFDGTAQSNLRLESDNDRITAIKMRFAANNLDTSRLKQAFTALRLGWPQALNVQSRANLSLFMQAALPHRLPSPALPPIAKKKQNSKKRKGAKPAAPMQAAKQQAQIQGMQAQDAQDKASAVPCYSALFSRDIWPYLHGEMNFTLLGGRLMNFNMPHFLSLLQAGQAFSLADANAAPANIPNAPNSQKDFAFDRIEGNIALDKGALNPLVLTVLFGGHRLELSGAADISANRLAVEGALDPVHLNNAGQCADIACLNQSLLPAAQFDAEGAPFTAALLCPRADAAAPPPKQTPLPAQDNSVHIVPRIGIMPY